MASGVARTQLFGSVAGACELDPSKRVCFTLAQPKALLVTEYCLSNASILKLADVRNIS